MTLLIKEKNLSERYIRYLIKNIKNQLYINLDDRNKLREWNNYLNNEIVQKKLFIQPKEIKVIPLITNIINNIIFVKQGDAFIIKIDDINKFPNSQLTYSELSNLINFGNLEIEGFYIFTKSFNYIKNNYKKYKNRYIILHR